MSVNYSENPEQYLKIDSRFHGNDRSGGAGQYAIRIYSVSLLLHSIPSRYTNSVLRFSLHTIYDMLYAIYEIAALPTVVRNDKKRR